MSTTLQLVGLLLSPWLLELSGHLLANNHTVDYELRDSIVE